MLPAIYNPRMPGAIAIPEIGRTDRLVELPALELRDAVTGARPRLATKLRLAHRAGELLVRFDCRHAGITATMRRDNDPLWKEDVVEAFLAFEDPPRRYLEVEVNPLGARFSARVESPHLSRDGMTVETFDFPDFRANAGIFQRRWSARLRLPLRGSGLLLANFFRIDRASGEFQALFPTQSDPPDFHRPDRFGSFRFS
jgi:hypothetical protein